LHLYCHADGIPTPKVSWYFRKRTGLSVASTHHNRNQHQRIDGNSNAASVVQHAMKQLTQQATSVLPLVDQVIQEGNTLIISNVTRNYSGIFECIANNSVPPAASRKIKVNIECIYFFLFIFLMC
jgi:hypothetical protein